MEEIPKFSTVESEFFDNTHVSEGRAMNSLQINDVEVAYRVDNQYPFLVSVVCENKEYPCIIMVDSQGNTVVSYCGYTYPVKVYSQKEQALRQIIKSSEAMVNSVVKVNAPMPGLIKTIFVTAGSKVKKGETLFLLEAMKMENSLKSPVAGVIVDIQIHEGDAVEKSFYLCSVKQA